MSLNSQTAFKTTSNTEFRRHCANIIHIKSNSCLNVGQLRRTECAKTFTHGWFTFECLYLYILWFLLFIIQLHHGLLWADHAGRGRLPSAGHDGCSPSVCLWGQMPWLGACAWPAVMQRRLMVPRVSGLCHRLVGGWTDSWRCWGTAKWTGFYKDPDTDLGCCSRGSEHRTVSGMRVSSQGVLGSVVPWGKIKDWREWRAVGGEGLEEMDCCSVLLAGLSDSVSSSDGRPPGTAWHEATCRKNKRRHIFKTCIMNSTQTFFWPAPFPHLPLFILACTRSVWKERDFIQIEVLNPPHVTELENSLREGTWPHQNRPPPLQK